MADAEIPNIAILAAGAEKQAGRIINAEAQNRAQELREAKTKQKGGREGFRNALPRKENTPIYKPASNEAFKTLLGGGVAELDSTGIAKLPTTPVPAEQKAAFEQGQEIIDKVSQVQTCLELLAEPATASTKFGNLKTAGARPELATITDFDALKAQALSTIYNDAGFQAMFPELINNTTLSPADKQKFIEEALLKDPKLRTKLSSRLAGIYERALDLKDITASELDKLNSEKTAAGVVLQQKIDEIDGFLAGRSIPGLTKAEIDTIIRTASDANVARNQLETLVSTKLGIKDGDQIRRYEVLLREQAKLAADIQVLEDLKLGPPPTTLRTADQANLTRWLSEKVQKDGDVSALVTTYPGGSSAADLATYKGQVKPIFESGNNTPTIIVDGINQAFLQRNIIKKADADILAKAAEAGRTKAKDVRKRLQQESVIMGDLEGAIAEAIADVMEARYDELAPLEAERLEKVAEEEEKKKGKEVGRGIRAVNEAMNRRWIGFNEGTRKKEIHRDQIGQDVHYLLYNGEDGLKKLMLANMAQSGMTGLKFKNNAGADVVITSTNYDSVILDNLDDDSKAILKAAYEADGEAYKKKLFGDYFRTREMWDRSFGLRLLGKIRGESALGTLGLKEHEWILLRENFGADVENALATNENAQKIIAEMQAKGLTPDFRFKWFLYTMAAAAGVGLTVATAGAAIPLGAGLAGLAATGLAAGATKQMTSN
jgi:hypothetical protein